MQATDCTHLTHFCWENTGTEWHKQLQCETKHMTGKVTEDTKKRSASMKNPSSVGSGGGRMGRDPLKSTLKAFTILKHANTTRLQVLS